MARKIAAVGDINGQLSSFFAKITELHSKHDFAFVVICGCLFADQASPTDEDQGDLAKLLTGEIKVPVQTYFSLGRRTLPHAVIQQLSKEDAAGDVCENLTFLGRKTMIKTSDAFKLVSVGGTFQAADPDEPISDFKPTYEDSDANVAKGYNNADILVTNDWPADIRRGSKAFFGGVNPDGSQKLSELCAALKPRYHFSASEHAFTREPFFHQGPKPQQLTSFISLASFGNSSKQKWIFAFNLEPSAPPPDTLPANATACPFTLKRKRDAEDSEAPSSFRFSNGHNANGGGHGRNKHRRPNPPPGPDKCFFCLSNPALETHMVCTLGDEAYLTVAKGPLPTPTTFPQLNGIRGHMLIIPHDHSATLAAISDPTSRQKTKAEMDRFRHALQSMLAAKSLDPTTSKPTLGAVTWTISRQSGVHLHSQFLPLPLHLITQDLITAAFEVEAANNNYEPFTTETEKIATIEAESDFFKAVIWNGESGEEKELCMPLPAGTRFDLQFGRRVLAKLLGLEKRVQWRDCGQSQQEEEADKDAFLEAFKEWDFTAPEC